MTTTSEVLASVAGQSFGHQLLAVRAHFRLVGPLGSHTFERDAIIPWLQEHKHKIIGLRQLNGPDFYPQDPTADEIDAWVAEHFPG